MPWPAAVSCREAAFPAASHFLFSLIMQSSALGTSVRPGCCDTHADAPESTGAVHQGDIMRALAVLSTVLVLAACSSSQPERVDSSNPTVTYKYYGDAYGGQFDEVAARAADYCNEQFGKAVRLKDVDEGNGDANFAVFECV
jgi:hypothetical protein